MTKFLSNLALAGSAVAAMLAISTGVSQATPMTQAEFLASIGDIDHICRLLDAPTWMKKDNYGCGNLVMCQGGYCVYSKKRKPHYRNPNGPIGVVALVRPVSSDVGGNGGRTEGADHGTDSGHRDGGKKGGGPNGPN